MHNMKMHKADNYCHHNHHHCHEFIIMICYNNFQNFYGPPPELVLTITVMTMTIITNDTIIIIKVMMAGSDAYLRHRLRRNPYLSSMEF